MNRPAKAGRCRSAPTYGFLWMRRGVRRVENVGVRRGLGGLSSLVEEGTIDMRIHSVPARRPGGIALVALLGLTLALVTVTAGHARAGQPGHAVAAKKNARRRARSRLRLRRRRSAKRCTRWCCQRPVRWFAPLALLDRQRRGRSSRVSTPAATTPAGDFGVDGIVEQHPERASQRGQPVVSSGGTEIVHRRHLRGRRAVEPRVQLHRLSLRIQRATGRLHRHLHGREQGRGHDDADLDGTLSDGARTSTR